MSKPPGRRFLPARVGSDSSPKIGESYFLFTSQQGLLLNPQIRWSALRCDALIALNSSLSLHLAKLGKMPDLLTI
jgi:hypothetical protein